MKNIYKWIVIKLGLKGSWSWACRQMDKGYIVKKNGITGTVKYKLDHENQRRILWTFVRNPVNKTGAEWDNANIFLSDFESTDWRVWGKA